MKIKAPKPPPEDPALAAARKREEARAENALIGNTQQLLQDELRRKTRRLGRRVALTGQGPAGAAGYPGAAAYGAPLVGGGGGSYDPATAQMYALAAQRAQFA
jgi:hypothetical protein